MREREIERLHANIGQLTVERDFFREVRVPGLDPGMSAPDRRQKLDRAHPVLSIRRQCALLSVARSGVYWPPPANDDADLALMRRIDELFMAWPLLGSRRMTAMLRAEGEHINRKRMQRLMRLMGIAALGPKPRTSKPAPGYKVFPYLLRGLAIERSNQVWCTDITYIPIGRGFLYLVAVMDWASRAVLSIGLRNAIRPGLLWRLSNTMDASFCIEALEEALARFGKPDIFNTDQGSQFTSAAFTGVLIAAGVRVERKTLIRSAATGQWTMRRETTFYASSVMLPAKTFATAIRNHWAIENRNHWVRDVTLAEDASRIRVNPGIIARLRSLALNIARANGVTNVAEALWIAAIDPSISLSYSGL